MHISRCNIDDIVAFGFGTSNQIHSIKEKKISGVLKGFEGEATNHNILHVCEFTLTVKVEVWVSGWRQSAAAGS